jgi:hypothetical protein
MGEIKRIDTQLKTGGRYEALTQGLLTGTRGGYDIGQLQTLHSELRKRRQAFQPVEAKQLLDDFAGAVDSAIFTGLVRGRNAATSDATRATLQQSRQAWSRLRAAEELGSIVEDVITSGRSGRDLTIHLGRIRDTVRKGTGHAGKSLLRAFEHDPAAKERFTTVLDTLGKEYDKITVSLRDLPPEALGVVAGKVGDVVATLLTTVAGQRLFRNLVTQGSGLLTFDAALTAANAVRREAFGAGASPLVTPQPMAPRAGQAPAATVQPTHQQRLAPPVPGP